ncbi:hypothetical protein [Pseudomonas sp. LF245]
MRKISFKSLMQAWCSVQSVCLFMVCVYLCALAIRVFQLDSGDVASWVQAVGAIISIWAAWWIARQQSVRAEVESRNLEVAKCLAVTGLLEHILRVVQHKPRKGQGTISGREVRSGLEKALSMLDRVDVLTLHDRVLVSAVLETRYAVEALDLKIADNLYPNRDALILFHYELGISTTCVGVLEHQIEQCKALVSLSKSP